VALRWCAALRPIGPMLGEDGDVPTRSRPALEAILAFDEALLADGRRAATRRQRHWALTDLAKHRAGQLGVDPAALSVTDLLDRSGVADWLAAADRGETRERGAGRASAAGQRARLATVRAFAGWVDLPVPIDETLPRISRLPMADHDEAAVAIRILSERRPPGVTEQLWVRTTALAALAVDTGARVGELALLRVADLRFGSGLRSPGLATVPHRPPGHRLPVQTGSYDPAYLRQLEFSAGTGSILRRWLGLRSDLVARLQGSDPHLLWVAVGGGGDRHGPPGHRPGMPVSARSLHRSWRRIADLLTAAEVPGVPRRLGALAGETVG
ncbi:MAG: hypothetical protein L0Y54_21085, partial [Sporichthyaceae bacterium]|nr:hypothetical protein [Sporichthyaceae bacterium]